MAQQLPRNVLLMPNRAGMTETGALTAAALPQETLAASSESMFNETRLKVLVIDAICGVGFPTPMLGTACEQAGMARYDMESGVYEWRRNALARSTMPQLQQLYDALCEARDDEFMGQGVDRAR